MGRKRRTKRQASIAYSFVVDGNTEVWYLKLMQRHEHERLPNIKIKPELPHNRSLESQYEQVLENAADYDLVVWIVDGDTIMAETAKSGKGAVTTLNKFKKYLEKLKKDFKDRVIVLVNSPCLEYWFLLHYSDTTRYYKRCDKVEHELKKFMPDYRKNSRYYNRESNDIYKKLKPRQSTAAARAKRLQCKNEQDPQHACAGIYKVPDLLKPKD